MVWVKVHAIIKRRSDMKKIKMKLDKKGSPDGVNVKQFKKNKTYQMPDSLAKVFIKEKWGKESLPEKIITPETLEKVEMLTPETIEKPKRISRRKKK